MILPRPVQATKYQTHWRVWFGRPGGARQASVIYSYVDVPSR